MHKARLPSSAFRRLRQEFSNFSKNAIGCHVFGRHPMLANGGQKGWPPAPQNRGKLANSIFFATQVLTSVDSSVWTRVCQPWQTRLAMWQTQKHRKSVADAHPATVARWPAFHENLQAFLVPSSLLERRYGTAIRKGHMGPRPHSL